jgi:YVTN family beta-propeller protein
MHRNFARVSIALLFICLTGCSTGADKPEPLINGKYLSADLPAGQDLGNLPVNVIVSPDGKYAITSDVGYFESLWSVRTEDDKGVAHLDFSNRRARDMSPATTRPGGEDSTAVNTVGIGQGLYYGLAISPDNLLYASQGNQNAIATIQLGDDGSLKQMGAIRTKPSDFPAGIALDGNGRLYVSNNASAEADNPYMLPGSMSIYDTKSRQELGRFRFTNSHGGTSNFPLGIAVSRDGTETYVAAERDDAVYVLDTHDPSNITQTQKIDTGAHPVALLLSPDQSKLYVSNSLSDTISVVDTSTNQVAATVLLRPSMARDLPGVTPLGMSLSPDNKRLYVALGDMNAVAVIDTGDQPTLLGYIPAGWYPTGVVVTHNGKQLLVVNGRGTNVRNPNNVPDPHDPTRRNAYVLSIVEGNSVALAIPDDDDLKKSTAEVLAENRLDTLANQPNPLANIGLAAGKITHVFYIIKENRTYDQILGDMPQGNGDPTLVLFGKSVTPNEHAIADRFALMDDLFACADVSADGWVWSTQSMADAYVVRNVPYQYSHRGREYDFEGSNNRLPTGGLPANDDDDKPLSSNPILKNGAATMPDVASIGARIWDRARDAGLSMRNYGFLLSAPDSELNIGGMPDNYPTVAGLLPAGHDLAGITDIDYRGFDLTYADSDAPAKFAAQTGNRRFLYSVQKFGKSNSDSRFTEWNREFQMMLAKSSDGSAVPALTLIRLPNDHTGGGGSNRHSPAAMVADNDYALGEIVQAISNSPVWTSSAIFVIEDDAQSGIDHVDAHRTTGYVISPWIKRNSIDHHFLNTDGMLKTIELILGLKPLSQYDAVADPIMDWDTSPSNSEPFTAIGPDQTVMAQINPNAADLPKGDPRREMAEESDKMDFTHADAAPADLLDEITWQTVKGPTSHIPIRRESPVGDGDDGKDDD